MLMKTSKNITFDSSNQLDLKVWDILSILDTFQHRDLCYVLEYVKSYKSSSHFKQEDQVNGNDRDGY